MTLDIVDFASFIIARRFAIKQPLEYVFTGRLEHQLQLGAPPLAGVSPTWAEVSADMSALASEREYISGQVGGKRLA